MSSQICILGDVVTDITLPQDGNEIKVRLGGITHSARGLWAMNVNYDAKFIAPNYLSNSIIKYYKHHGASDVIQIGVVTGAPYTFLIGSVKETGDQFYDFILREQIEISFDSIRINKAECAYDDLLLISGNFDVKTITSSITKDLNVHIDLSNNIQEITDLQYDTYHTIFLSTSSELFKKHYKNLL